MGNMTLGVDTNQSIDTLMIQIDNSQRFVYLCNEIDQVYENFHFINNNKIFNIEIQQ